MSRYKIYYDNICIDNTIGEIIKFIKTNPEKKYYKLLDDKKILINNDFVVNTQFITHRINKISELENIDLSFGVEIDIRDDHVSNKLILAHDPFVNGDDFETYLSKYRHNTLILNIKSERVEIPCLELLKKYNIRKNNL